MNPKDHELDVLMRARYPILAIVSPEEERVESALKSLVNGTRQILIWSATQPFAPSDTVSPDGHTRALEALDFIAKKLGDDVRAVFILRDFDAYLSHPLVARRMRDLASLLKRSHATVVLLSPVLNVPPHLEKEIVVLDYDLPRETEIGELLDQVATRALDESFSLPASTRAALAQAALGLTADEAINVFNKALVQRGTLDESDIETVLAEKKQIIRKSGALEFYEATAHFSDIGGLGNLKAWLDKRRGAWGDAARNFGLPAPRGVLLLGVPGCGKSLTAKAIGAQWKLPLLRFDVNAIFGKYVGESEANLRRALRAAEAVAPCVLWIDELEKAFSSTRGDDGGTTLRILGGFLSWLQEKRAPVFVVATANGIKHLPPELLRRGRLDETFFIDLPDEDERRAIFRIHLHARRRNAEDFDLETLVQASREYSGAEIEGAIVAALFDAFDENAPLKTRHIHDNLQATVPLSVTMNEEIARLRDWASTRARRAS